MWLRSASQERVALAVALAASLLLGGALARIGPAFAVFLAALPLGLAMILPGRHRALLAGAVLALTIPSWWEIGLPQANAYRVASVLALVPLLMGEWRLRLCLADVLVLAFLLDSLVSAVLQTAEPGIGSVLLYILMPAAFYLAARALPHRLHRRVVATAVAAITLGAVTVVAERVVGHVLFQDPQSYSWVPSNGGIFRPGGIYGSPPAASLALAIGVLLAGSLRGVARRGERAVLSASIATILLALVLTFERSAVIALAAGGVAYALLIGIDARAVLRYSVAAGFVILLAVLAYPQVKTSTALQNGVLRQGTLSARTSIWQEELPVVTSSKRTAAIGVGFATTILARTGGNVPPALATHPRLISTSIHNQYLLILLEQGGIGLAIFLMFLGSVTRLGVRFSLRTRDPFAAGLTASLVALLVLSLTTTPILDYSSWILSLLVIGLLVSYTTPADERPEPRLRPSMAGRVATPT
jgi:O-antigen ligase